jgi:hypothetical protein
MAGRVAPTCARGPDGRFPPSVHGWGKGPGWGGPAKGCGNGASTALRPSAEQFASPGARTEAQALREERRELLELVFFDLAMNAEREETRLQAAFRLLAMLRGG